ncbi:signal transduction protein with GAF and PtsI domain [Salibacterium salarium]|uniref:Uncharacterized protein n=1 Tax=Salibacterium salarium TaxID=284579 RepID=A0A3R9Q0R4_9BACI|nr:DUF5665 domain-containing protein [Salibacterium salarium]MDQ0298758.1 signal transduction protein with GAF and PtsI domain [Salibacterium salarium]RSL31165.1 hypothetical protein D7Z54_21905 [Salibacterium salarium]
MKEHHQVKNRRLKKQNRSSDTEEVKRLENLVNRLDEITTKSRMKDMAYHFTKPSEVIKTNLIAGVARGVGLTVGTGLFLAILLFILSQFETMPIIGEYIGDLLNVVEDERE